jgi:hypothetical protein
LAVAFARDYLIMFRRNRCWSRRRSLEPSCNCVGFSVTP